MKRNTIALLEASREDITKALNVFKYDSIDKIKNIDKVYKKLAMEYHPDRGGSDEQMQELNWAKELLEPLVTGAKNQKNTISDWKARNEKENKTLEELVKKFKEKFNPDIYTEHFKQFGNYEYNKEFTNVFKDGPSIEVTYEWKAEKSLLQLSVYFRLPTASLGGTTDDMNVTYTTFVYVNGKKTKMGVSDYQWNKSVSTVHSPELIFPTAKMNKALSNKNKVTKKDVFAGLQIELGAKLINSDSWYIPLKDDLFLKCFRMSYRSVPAYFCTNIFKKSGTYFYNLYQTISGDKHPEIKDFLVNVEDANTITNITKVRDYVLNELKNKERLDEVLSPKFYTTDGFGNYYGYTTRNSGFSLFISKIEDNKYRVIDFKPNKVMSKSAISNVSTKEQVLSSILHFTNLIKKDLGEMDATQLATLLSANSPHGNISTSGITSVFPELKETKEEGHQYGEMTLVGFSPKDLENTIKILDSSKKLMKKIGMEKAFYGKVVATSAKSSKLLATYHGDTDHITLRPDGLKVQPDITIIHELGHRIWRKYLSEEQKKKVNEKYYEVMKKEQESLLNEGDVFENDKTRFEVKGSRQHKGSTWFAVDEMPIGTDSKKITVDSLSKKEIEDITNEEGEKVFKLFTTPMKDMTTLEKRMVLERIEQMVANRVAKEITLRNKQNKIKSYVVKSIEYFHAKNATQVSGNNNKKKSNPFDVTTYARKDVKEFFSEILGHGLVKNIKEIIKFLEDLLK